ncbi:peptidase, M23/M37 family [Shewanella sp. HN-41]|nr:peptidase, M23/M37 family [Shewanella sp. HN-41]
MLLPSEEAQASRQTTAIDEQAQINTRYDVPLAFRSPQRPESMEEVSDNAPTNAVPMSSSEDLAAGKGSAESLESAHHRDVEHFNVKNGDTLAAVFDRAGLTSKDVYEITQLPLAKQNLLKIMPGEEIVISKDAKGDLTEVRYRINAISTLVITKNQEQYFEKNLRERCGDPNPFHQR